MPDKKLTDSEIVKTLECCKSDTALCNECPYDKIGECIEKMCADSIDLINRLQAENERLKKAYLRNQEIFAKQSLENERLKVEIDFYKHSPMITIFEQWKKEIEAEAVKEFAERLIAVSHPYADTQMVFEVQIDNLLKELVGNNETVL